MDGWLVEYWTKILVDVGVALDGCMVEYWTKILVDIGVVLDGWLVMVSSEC